MQNTLKNYSFHLIIKSKFREFQIKLKMTNGEIKNYIYLLI